MTNLREAAQQALEAWDGGDIEWFKRAYTVMENLRAALAQQDEPCPNCASLEAQNTELDRKLAELEQAEPVQEPVATVTECEACFTPDVCQLRGTCDYYTASQMRIAAPPRCPNCASLEAQNTELDRKLAELEQAYQSGYNAGVAHERKRIIQFLNEMQRQVGDGHNYYGVAAMRIRERV